MKYQRVECGHGWTGNLQTFEKPFKYTVIDDFISPEDIKAIHSEWPDEVRKEEGSFTHKWSTSELPPTARRVFESIDISMLENVTGIQGLFPDPEMSGGGLHAIPRGGFLKMHIDFNQHRLGWHRRCNVLIYLNEDWDESWGGQLLLGKNREVSVVPIAGRCVIFETTEESWHGHPDKLGCPADRQRRSLAFYYFTKDPPKEKQHSTIYIK